MNTNNPQSRRPRVIRRRGLSSVLAMMYLMVIAMLSVGFYAAVNMGSTIADNDQYIHRSGAASEAAMAFVRYQLAQISVPVTTPANTLAKVFSGGNGQNGVATILNGTGNMNSHNPVLTPSGTPSGSLTNFANYTVGGFATLPGATGTSPNFVPSWMSTDNTGGQAYVELAEIPNTTNLLAMAIAQNSNSKANGNSITRKIQLQFDSVAGPNPIFGFGLVSYAEIMLNANVTVNGTNSGVLSAASAAPISVTGSSSFAGDFYWTSATARTSVTWGSLKVSPGQYLSSSGQFPNHVHGGLAALNMTPTAPTFDSITPITNVTTGVITPNLSGYVGTANGGTSYTSANIANALSGGVYTFNNADLAAGTYVFNNPVTINGILYLDSGGSPGNKVQVTFNNPVTLNGAIVQNNSSTSLGVQTTSALASAIVFGGVLNQQSMQSAGLNTATYPLAEQTLAAGSAIILPTDSVTFNKTVTTQGSIVGNSLVFNANTTVSAGSVMNMSNAGQMVFNSAATISVNTTGATPAGVKSNNLTFVPVPSSYTEVYP